MEFILSGIILLITIRIKGELSDDVDLLNWGLFSLASEINDLIFSLILKQTCLYMIFILLLFRKLHFHLSIAFNAFSEYFLFLIGTIIFNILGFISFSVQAEDEIYEEFSLPLINENEEVKEIISDNKEKENNLIVNDYFTVNNDNTITNYYDTTPDGNNNDNNGDKENQFTDGHTNNNEIDREKEDLKNENKELKSENKELKSENKSLNLKIKSLKVKIGTLEETIEKLYDKIASLTEEKDSNDTNK